MRSLLIRIGAGNKECLNCRYWKGTPRKINCEIYGKLEIKKAGFPVRHGSCLADESAAYAAINLPS